MQGVSEQASATATPVPARTASLWRRLFAFVVDLVLVGALGKLLAFLAPLSDTGAYGRLLGWGLMIGYFAAFDGALASGRSIGKRLTGICVVRSDNTYLSPLEAALRAALVTAPITFGGMAADTLMLKAVLNLAAGGLFLAMLYLLALSNDSRQVLLHDLAFGTLVVRHEDHALSRPLPTVAPLARGHAIVVGLILLASVLLPVIDRLLGW